MIWTKQIVADRSNDRYFFTTIQEDVKLGSTLRGIFISDQQLYIVPEQAQVRVMAKTLCQRRVQGRDARRDSSLQTSFRILGPGVARLGHERSIVRVIDSRFVCSSSGFWSEYARQRRHNPL